MVVIFSGGGTAGHFHPARNIAEALTEIQPGARPYFVGTEGRIEARELPRLGYPYRLLPVAGLRHPFRSGRPLAAFAANAKALWLLFVAVCKLVPDFRRMAARAVVLTGGYASAPAGIAARLLRLPVVLQEQNSRPGKVTRLVARWARQIHVAYPEAKTALAARARPRVRDTGNPIRPLPMSATRGRDAARQALGLPADRAVVLVVGGSQGAQAINDAMVQVIENGMPSDERFVYWITGSAHFEPIASALTDASREGLAVVPYLEPTKMYQALAAADVAVSRAGAMATSEFLAWGLPSILVPLPTAAADHQTINARALEAAGAAKCVLERDRDGRRLDGEALWGEVESLLRDSRGLAAMSRAASRRARPDAAREVAVAIAEVLA